MWRRLVRQLGLAGILIEGAAIKQEDRPPRIGRASFLTTATQATFCRTRAQAVPPFEPILPANQPSSSASHVHDGSSR
jgi:hypothetical protein